MSEAAAHRPAPDLVLARYTPLRPLGSGGSGSVWLARDEATGLDVALKIVAREGKAANRAEREAEAGARLRHPSCLRAYHFGRDRSHVYIVYEYAPGRTFREALRGGELDDESAVEAAAQVLDGLAHAHARGIVHRDVKPANVLLVDGPAVSARLLDFGLAQFEEAETLTAAGDVPGTLAYIPPERLRGGEGTPAGDVWSLGVMLWEALAGRHPFWRSSFLETGRAIEAGAEPLATLRPDLPAELTTAVDRALALDPARRPSAAKLAAILRARAPRTRRGGRPFTAPVGRLIAAGLAGLLAGGAAAVFPFYPAGWAAGLGALAALLALLRPRLGLVGALAVPLLPLGNASLGLAVLYAVVALAWVALAWREPASGLVFALGPVLAPAGLLGFLPLVLARVASPLRRLAQAAAAALCAFVIARPETDSVARSEEPLEVAGVLASGLAARPELWHAAVLLAAAAASLPLAAGRGRWWIAGWGAAVLTLGLVPAPHLPVLPLVVAVWGTCAALTFRSSI
jgi:Protein kinase domain